MLGEVYMGKAFVYRFRENIGHKEDRPIHEGVHWDMFLSPEHHMRITDRA